MLPQHKLNFLVHHHKLDPSHKAWRRWTACMYMCEQINARIQILERLYMPRKARKDKTTDWQVTFSTLKLSAGDKKAFETWAKSNADDMFLILYPEVLQSGIKCSLSYDRDHDTFIFSMTDRDPGSENHNVCMVSRSNSHEEAMLIGLYKHFVLCDDCPWPIAGSDDWG